MKKRAAEILHRQVQNILIAKSKAEFEKSLIRLAELADLLDQAGDESSANRLDNLLKQAGFWSSLFSGMSGGGGVAIWDAIKGGKFKESLGIIVKKALMGAAAGVMVDYIIQWLDGIPFIGNYLKELEGSDKLRMLLEGVVAGAVAESDFANKLVDKTIIAVEGLFGWGHAEQKPQVPGVKPTSTPAAALSLKSQTNENSGAQSLQGAPGANPNGLE